MSAHPNHPARPGKYHDAHEAENRAGPGDSRPTAMQIVKDENLLGALTGKVAVITGTSNGIGVETVRALRAAGATVIATARKEAALKEKIKEIEDESPGSAIIPVIIDQESLESVRKGAAEILEKSGGKITWLICNAGVMATPQGKTKDGFETQFGVCHLSHFLLFSLLKDALLAGSTAEFNSRVVMVSSIGHQTHSVFLDDYNIEKAEYNEWTSYGQAKTSNIWMANEIDRKYGSQGLHALALHPGGIQTGLSKHVDAETLKAWDNPVSRTYYKSIPQGAATSVHAALSKEWEGNGGKWLSNCEEPGPYGVGGVQVGLFRLGDDGYKEWAFDVNGAKKLWADSCKMVGIEDY
jgi:NAD(P)-dependent dehydrogenase (short-subunit alcohol dehydrogenase family)